MTILVTGGCGYIGSHTILCLIEFGYDVVIVDNLCNSSATVIDRIELLTTRKVELVEGNILDKKILRDIFKKFDIEAVIHFAALKSVSESIRLPEKYYENNVEGTLRLLDVMKEANVSRFIFSSSATVYGSSNPTPYVESMEFGNPTSPYGQSKILIEKMLRKFSREYFGFKAVSLRYFNPIGAHSSGMIGEDPKDVPSNLIPYLTQVAVGRRDSLKIFGNNYDTKDGTCIRDYIHIMDLAEGHVKALKWLEKNPNLNEVEAYNLGTGEGFSVLQIIDIFQNVTGIKIPYVVTDRRKGDLAAFWADPAKAKRHLDWIATRSMKDMLMDSWKWQKNNPNGFEN